MEVNCSVAVGFCVDCDNVEFFDIYWISIGIADRFTHLRVKNEVSKSIGKVFGQFIVFSCDKGREERLFETQPQTIDGIEIGGISREKKRSDVAPEEIIRFVPCGVIHDHHNLFVTDVFVHLVKKDLKSDRIHVRHDQANEFPVTRANSADDIVPEMFAGVWGVGAASFLRNNTSWFGIANHTTFILKPYFDFWIIPHFFHLFFVFFPFLFVLFDGHCPWAQSLVAHGAKHIACLWVTDI